MVLIPAVLYLWLYLSYLQVIRDKHDAIKGLLARGGAMKQYVNAYGTTGEDAEQIASRILQRNNYARMSYLRALVFTSFLTTMATAVAIARAGLPISLPSRVVEMIMATPYLGVAPARLYGVFMNS
jgi:hypothetical protein